MNKNKFYKKLTSGIFYFSILLFIIAFNFSDNGNGGWQLQTLPFLNNRPLTDMTFTDSLTGFGITGDGTVGDTNYILKTTNGGNNWNIIFSVYRDLSRVIFINGLTGFVSGGFNASGGYLIKTNDGGNSWIQINTPEALRINDMSVISEDSLWITSNFFTYSLFSSTNGGLSWDLKYTTGNGIDKIYFFDKNLGFFGNNFELWKTTNYGNNWLLIPGQKGFADISFSDSLIGWKRNGSIGNDTLVKTTDGGLTWKNTDVPRSGLIYGGNLIGTIGFFESINKDTVWGAGGQLKYSNTRYRGVLYRSTNGGQNWLVQVPDTSLGISYFGWIDFIGKSNGWSYNNENGIHTTSGGDTTFYTKINNNNLSISHNFILYQNYPNPFNPSTNISYEIKQRGSVLLKVFNTLGKEIMTLVDQTQNTGNYKVNFSGSGLSSGVYFYSLFIHNKRMDTKKMLLLK